MVGPGKREPFLVFVHFGGLFSLCFSLFYFSVCADYNFEFVFLQFLCLSFLFLFSLSVFFIVNVFWYPPPCASFFVLHQPSSFFIFEPCLVNIFIVFIVLLRFFVSIMKLLFCCDFVFSSSAPPLLWPASQQFSHINGFHGGYWEQWISKLWTQSPRSSSQSSGQSWPFFSLCISSNFLPLFWCLHTLVLLKVSLSTLLNLGCMFLKHLEIENTWLDQDKTEQWLVFVHFVGLVSLFFSFFSLLGFFIFCRFLLFSSTLLHFVPQSLSVLWMWSLFGLFLGVMPFFWYLFLFFVSSCSSCGHCAELLPFTTSARLFFGPAPTTIL